MRFAYAALISGVLALAGCGAEEFVRDRDAILRIKLDEYRLEPANIRVASRSIRVEARNTGRLTHNVKVLALDREEGEPFEEFGGTPTAHPGETVTVDLKLAPGKYRLACTIANHDDLGQFGELQVGS